MSLIGNISASMSAEDELEVITVITVLEQTFGEASTSRFVEKVFKLGFIRVLELSRARDMSAVYEESSVKQISFVSPNTETAMLETSIASTSSGVGTDPKEAMSDGGMRPGAVMACKCYRKVPYKTARGLREHLVLKHGLAPFEAEVKANLTFHESNRSNIHPQKESNEEPPLTGANVHETMNDGGKSQEFDWDAFVTNQEPYQLQMVLDKKPCLGPASGCELENSQSQTGNFGF